MFHGRRQNPDESILYRRAVAGMGNGSRLLLSAVAANPSGFVVLLDLDNMGQVNRKFGTRVGDRLMAAVESRLREVLEGHGDVAHFGGDQFLAVVSGSAEPASVVPDLLTAIRQLGVRGARVTASAGICQWTAGRAEAHELVSAAVRALEEVKSAAHAQPRWHISGPVARSARYRASIAVTADSTIPGTR